MFKNTLQNGELQILRLYCSEGFMLLAVGKFGLRALAQSLAREYGPRGVHVAHAIIGTKSILQFVVVILLSSAKNDNNKF